MAPNIDQQILERVPDDLIRPLFALCMRTLRYNSFDTYEQILGELGTIDAVHENLDVQLLRSHLVSTIRLRMRAMQDVQEWLRAQGHIAEPTEVYVNRSPMVSHKAISFLIRMAVSVAIRSGAAVAAIDNVLC